MSNQESSVTDEILAEWRQLPDILDAGYRSGRATMLTSRPKDVLRTHQVHHRAIIEPLVVQRGIMAEFVESLDWFDDPTP